MSQGEIEDAMPMSRSIYELRDDQISFIEKQRIDADIIMQTIEQRNENFELRQRLENLSNFREISHIELGKLRTQYEAVCKEKTELNNIVRQQREEVLKLKKITERLDQHDEFSNLDFSKNDWIANRDVYAKYINFLKMDNESKNFKLEQMELEIARLNKRMDEGTVDQNFMNIPKPGEEFESLTEHSKGNYYRKVYLTLMEFRREIDLAFDQLERSSREHNEKMEKFKVKHKTEVEALNKKVDALSKRAEFQNLYVSANKRIKDLEAELEAQTKYFEDNLKDREAKLKLETEKISDMNKQMLMVNEKMASMRKELDIANKKYAEAESKLRKKGLADGGVPDPSPATPEPKSSKTAPAADKSKFRIRPSSRSFAEPGK